MIEPVTGKTADGVRRAFSIRKAMQNPTQDGGVRQQLSDAVDAVRRLSAEVESLGRELNTARKQLARYSEMEEEINRLRSQLAGGAK